jgi:hypothetical protein
VIDSFWGVSTLGRPSDHRRTLEFFFHAEDPSFLSFADHVRGQENTTVRPIDRARQAWSMEQKISFSGARTDHGP